MVDSRNDTIEADSLLSGTRNSGVKHHGFVLHRFENRNHSEVLDVLTKKLSKVACSPNTYDGAVIILHTPTGKSEYFLAGSLRDEAKALLAVSKLQLRLVIGE